MVVIWDLEMKNSHGGESDRSTRAPVTGVFIPTHSTVFHHGLGMVKLVMTGPK